MVEEGRAQVASERVGARLVAFALALVLVFGAAFGLGRAVGPVGDDAPPAHSEMDMDHGGDP